MTGRQEVSLPNGARIAYCRRGPEHGPAVLLLHGLSDSAYSFERIWEAMPADLHVIAPDQRGHGESSKPAGGYSMSDFASDALQLLDTLSVERATIIGHSMGSFVARRIAECARQRVERLVLVGTALVPDNEVVRELARSCAGLTDPVDPVFIREFQESTVCRPLPPNFFAGILRESGKVPAHVWRACVTEILAYTPQWPLTCPTLILGGSNDAVFSASEQNALCQVAERSWLHLEPGIGHALPWEAPERFLQLAFEAETAAAGIVRTTLQ